MRGKRLGCGSAVGTDEVHGLQIAAVGEGVNDQLRIRESRRSVGAFGTDSENFRDGGCKVTVLGRGEAEDKVRWRAPDEEKCSGWIEGTVTENVL